MTTQDAFKAALWTALFSFLALFGVSLIGWTGDVVEWANNEGATAFPSLSVLGYAAVSAFGAAMTGLLNFVVRFAQSKGVFGQSAVETGPSYSAIPPAGG